MSAAAFVVAARALVGTPYRHQGRLPDVGLDCVGVVILAARAIGIELRDQAGYAANPSGGLLLAAIDGHADVFQRVADRQPGDVLLMRFSSEPQHVAILSERDTLIHSYSTVGQVCEHRFAEVWRARVLRAYRLVTP